MTNTGMIKIAIAAFVAALAISGIVSISSFAAEANNTQSNDTNIIQTTSDNSSDEASQEKTYEQRRYEYNMYIFRSLQNQTTNVKISNVGLYHAKSVKLYGRKIVDVDKNTGDYILSNWECLTDACINGYSDLNFKISGSYVAFAYSFDITWGTDFPYSGIFYDDIYNFSANDIEITMGGCVRNASIEIKVGHKTLVDVMDCGSHSEWRP